MRAFGKIAATLGAIGAIAASSTTPAAAWYGYRHIPTTIIATTAIIIATTIPTTRTIVAMIDSATTATLRAVTDLSPRAASRAAWRYSPRSAVPPIARSQAFCSTGLQQPLPTIR
jgi:hypothetical protein